MVGWIVVAVVGLWWVMRRRRKKKRETSADALTQALGLVRPYEGPTWGVGKNPRL